MKKTISAIIVVAAVFLLWHFVLPIEKFSQGVPAFVKSITPSSALTQIQNIQEQIFAPTPLKSNSLQNSQNSALTNSGVIYWTNSQRNQNGSLRVLKENTKLDQAAASKLKDMFDKQYFEHVSPSGAGPSSLAKAAGYKYISIGENLALGFFDSDEQLVQAWMDSPGHRANILNTKFEEIGVAVGKGIYEGKETWMAVQEFGRPQSSCPGISSALKSEITSLQTEINDLQSKLAGLKSEIDSANPQTKDEYNQYNSKVADYNNLVKIFNNKVDTLKLATNQYNAQVSDYNSCLGS